MWRITTVVFTLFLVMVMSGCQENGDVIRKVALDEYEDVFKGKKTGFLIISNIGMSDDQVADMYLDTLEQTLEEEKVNALQYDVYKADGTNGNNEHINPYSDVTDTESLHYIKDGKVVSIFHLTDYEGLQLKEELKHYINLMNRK